jgi:hypothetical protein
MKFQSLNPNYRAAFLLIATAGVLVAAALLTNRNDFTSAVLILAGLVCILTGIFFVTVSGSDPVDLRYLSLFPVQGSIGMSRMFADLGVQGNAYFIPKGRDGRTKTVQFVPVAVYHGGPLPEDTFVAGGDTAGILAEPSCAPLARLLREREHLAVPHEMASLHNLVRELGVDVLDVAGSVTSTHDGGMITVNMEEYRLISGCRALIEESPRCCIQYPCPVCSLFASVFAEGTSAVVQVERCAPDPKRSAVTAVFSILPE